MLRLAILSYWHVHAKDYARDAEKHPDTVVTTVWDTDVERGTAAAEEIGAMFEPDLAVVLADPRVVGDAVELRAAAQSLRARVVLASVAVPDGGPRHDPVALAGALHDVLSARRRRRWAPAR